MSYPITSLQSDTGNVTKKIISRIRKIARKKMKLLFLGSLRLWQLANRMVSEVNIFSKRNGATEPQHFSFGMGLCEV